MNIRQTVSSEFWKQYGNVDKFARESKLNPKTVFKFLYNDEYNPKIGTLCKMLEVLGLELIVREIEHE